MSTRADTTEIKFGPFPVTEQVFYKTRHSFGLVNLKPIVPGHVLVCPLTPHRRLTDLSAEETADLFTAVQHVQRMLARVYFRPGGDHYSGHAGAGADGGSFTVAVQDGPEAGQTVPHVHVHVIPRRVGAADLGVNGSSPDEIYNRMASEDGNIGGALWDDAVGARPRPGGSMPLVEDENRHAREDEDMHDEADTYKIMLGRMEMDTVE